MISKPMLAATIKSVEELDFSKGYLATPKLDGIRALKIGGKLVSRTFKPIRNAHIRTILEAILPDGADGEVIINTNNFQDTASGVMSEEGTPDFTFHWFDYVSTDLTKGYFLRIRDMLAVNEALKHEVRFTQYVKLLLPTQISSVDELKIFEERCLNDGFEGVILRTPDGPYKCGRSTMREQYLMKYKRFEDSEAVVVGFEEKMHNNNDAEQDAFGRTKRSSAQEGLVPANTLGALIVKDITTGVKFSIGTGLDDAQRKNIWTHRDKVIGKIVTYKFFAQSGVKDKPRFPVFKAFRDKDDM